MHCIREEDTRGVVKERLRCGNVWESHFNNKYHITEPISRASQPPSYFLEERIYSHPVKYHERHIHNSIMWPRVPLGLPLIELIPLLNPRRRLLSNCWCLSSVFVMLLQHVILLLRNRSELSVRSSAGWMVGSLPGTQKRELLPAGNPALTRIVVVVRGVQLYMSS